MAPLQHAGPGLREHRKGRRSFGSVWRKCAPDFAQNDTTCEPIENATDGR